MTVSLLDKDGNKALYGNETQIPDTITDSDGSYLFSNLEPGTYKVKFANGDGNYKFTGSNSSQGTAKDSDAINVDGTGATATSNPVTVKSGENRTDIDAGMYLAQIGDTVWDDLDADGIKESGEPGIKNVTVTLYQADGSTVAKDEHGDDVPQATTDANGRYLFKDLKPGNYIIGFTKPAGYDKFTKQFAESDMSIDSDADRATGKTNSISIAAGERNMNIDAGAYKLASIGDKVWNDKNANGIQDSGETGIDGVSVKLLDSLGNQALYEEGSSVGDIITASGGKYSFTGLEPGKYEVEFINPDTISYVFSLAKQGSDTVDSDGIVSADNTATTSAAIILKSGDNNVNVDAGLHKALIGDYVWIDKNGNGMQETGEVGISGVRVDLLDGLGNTIASTTSSATGLYEFNDLDAGNYQVFFHLPNTYSFTKSNASGVAADKNSDADTSSGKTATISLSVGQVDKTWDAGMYVPGSLGDYVWNDQNANGVQDTGEKGISGVMVRLLDGTGQPIKDSSNNDITKTTDANGKYRFDNLYPGSYKLEFTNPDKGKYTFSTSSVITAGNITADKSLAVSSAVTLSSGTVNLNVDAGLHKAVIGDYVWIDKNGNGIQDDVDKYTSGIIVELLDQNGDAVKDSSNNPVIRITDSNGKYEFDNLEAGTYKVKFHLPSGYAFSLKKSSGSTASNDSDADISTGITDSITLFTGQVDKTWDAGLYVPAKLGDFVWFDKNMNGIQDTGEPGIEGVAVKLLDVSMNPVTEILTDSTGHYSFNNLIPGNYTVQFVKPSHYDFTDVSKGTAAMDSDADKITGKTSTVTLSSSDNVDTVDAGLTVNSKILLQKTVYLGHDGGHGTGVENVEGQNSTPITYLFKITNMGNTYINSLTLQDDDLHINKPQMQKLSGSELLAPGESIVYYYETVINSDLTNTAQAGGIPCDNTGAAIPNADKVVSSDTAVIGEQISAIKIEKTVYAGNDSGAQTGGKLVTGEKGTPITYVFTVTNIGNICLKDISIDDSDLKIDKSKMIYKGRSETGLSQNDPLGVGATITYYYETAIDGDLTNTAKVEGTPSDNTGNTISTAGKAYAQNTASAHEVKPAMAVEKTVYIGHDGGKGIGTKAVAGKIGTDVTYAFKIKNTGDTYLKDITINDATLGIAKSDMTLISGNEPLAPGGTIAYYYDNAKINGNLINTVTSQATACDALGNSLPNTHNPYSSDTASVKISASLGNYIWEDANHNGIQDSTEKGIPNVKVTLTDGASNIMTTTTDSDGKYVFDNIMPGNYRINIDKTTLPVGFAESYELDNILDDNVSVSLASGQIKGDVNFGYYKKPSSGGFGGGGVITIPIIPPVVPPVAQVAPPVVPPIVTPVVAPVILPVVTPGSTTGENSGNTTGISTGSSTQNTHGGSTSIVNGGASGMYVGTDSEVNTGSSAKAGNSKLPKTGTENFNLLLYGLIALISSGASILRRRKEKNN